jgi:hypothetical protein
MEANTRNTAEDPNGDVTNRATVSVILLSVLEMRPRYSSSGYSLASLRGGPGPSPSVVKWDLWWTK